MLDAANDWPPAHSNVTNGPLDLAELAELAEQRRLAANSYVSGTAASVKDGKRTCVGPLSTNSVPVWQGCTVSTVSGGTATALATKSWTCTSSATTMSPLTTNSASATPTGAGASGAFALEPDEDTDIFVEEERARQRESETERQRDRETERQRERGLNTKRQIGGERARETRRQGASGSSGIVVLLC